MKPPTSPTLPADRIVPIAAEPGRYIWGRGPYRAEVWRCGGTRWKWRVWHVIGPVTHGKADGWTLKATRETALKRLAEVADAGLPGKDILAGV
jgi:hypothetical protein